MIADDGGPLMGLLDAIVNALTAPIWLPITIGKRLLKRKPKLERPVWSPQTDLERAVYAALIVAGKPVTNDELARLMRVSKGESSKRVSALNGQVNKVRIGREVRISLPN